MDNPEKDTGGGCLGSIILIVLIFFIVRSCAGGSDGESKTVVENEEKAVTYEVSVELDYEEVITTTNAPINVYIDGEEIGHHQEAGTEKVYNLSLTEGEHKIKLKNDTIYSTKSISFYVDDENTYFSFGTKTRLSFGMKLWKND